MVQTEEQYVFIHDAIVEAIRSGNTEVDKADLTAYVDQLTQPIPAKPRPAPPKADQADKDLMLIAVDSESSLSKGDEAETIPVDATTILDDKQEVIEMTDKKSAPTAKPLCNGTNLENGISPETVSLGGLRETAEAAPDQSTTTVLEEQFRLITEFRPGAYQVHTVVLCFGTEFSL